MNGLAAIVPIPHNALVTMHIGNVARLLPPVEVWAVSQAHSPGSNSNPLYASPTTACPLCYHQFDTVGPCASTGDEPPIGFGPGDLSHPVPICAVSTTEWMKCAYSAAPASWPAVLDNVLASAFWGVIRLGPRGASSPRTQSPVSSLVYGAVRSIDFYGLS